MRTDPVSSTLPPRQGPSKAHLVALTGSAVMAGMFAPEAIVDGIDYLDRVVNMTKPLATQYLPWDFKMNATLGAVGTFNTAWFLYFATQAGREPRHGAPLDPSNEA